MSESPEMPRYLKVSHYNHSPDLDRNSLLWISGSKPQKIYFPDLVNGVSREFPRNLKVNKELVSKITNYNSLADEDLVLNTKKETVRNYAKTLRNTPQRSRFATPSPDLSEFSHKTKLLRNTDPLSGKLTDSHRSLADPKIYNADILSTFQTFHIRENRSPIRKSCVSLPQKGIEVYNCVLNDIKVVKPPDLVLEAASPFEENYAQLVNTKGAFNKKKGMFTYMADKSLRIKRLEEIEKMYGTTKMPVNFGATRSSLAEIRRLLQPVQKYTHKINDHRSKSLNRVAKHLVFQTHRRTLPKPTYFDDLREIGEYEAAKEARRNMVKKAYHLIKL